MYFLLIGIVGILLKYLEIAPVSDWSWLIVLSPFALAVAWWAFADASGYTKRKEIEKMAERKQKRLDQQHDALGMIKKRK